MGAAHADARRRAPQGGAGAGPRGARGRWVRHVRVRGAGRSGRRGRRAAGRRRGAGRGGRGGRAVSAARERGRGLLVLVGPSRTAPEEAARVARAAREAGAAGIMLGSSFDGTQTTELVARAIREAAAGLPVTLFPGSALQLTGEVDLILFLSLISGRNAQYLIKEPGPAVPFLSPPAAPTP